MKTTLLFLSVFLSVSLFGQELTYVPDDLFEQHLIGLGLDDVLDDYVLTSNIENITRLDFPYQTIGPFFSDLTGIEDFASLTYLRCGLNQITNLDVSNNGNLDTLICHLNWLTELNLGENNSLKYLDCAYNGLQNINISQLPYLSFLNISFNQITNIDLTQNNLLTEFWCVENQLNSLDASANTELQLLYCQSNNIEYLDLSQNINLDSLYCNNNSLYCLNVANGNNFNLGLNAQNNPNLNCIEVDEVVWAWIQWPDFTDPQVSFSEDCNNDCTSSLTELSTSNNLIKILDMMGRETSFKPNTPLIYVYDDGSTEKVFSVE